MIDVMLGTHSVRLMQDFLGAVNNSIRAEMARTRVSQTVLGQRLGMSQGSLSRRLTGEVDWTISELFAVASALDVPITVLLPSGGEQRVSA